MAEKLSNSIALAGAQSGMGIASSAINNTIGSMIQTHNAKELMKEQQKYWDLQFKKQNERQNWLLSNQLKLEMDAKRNAGLSVLWNGQTPQTVGVSNPSVVSANGGNGSYQGSPVDLAQISLLEAQKRNLDADSHNKEAQANQTEQETSRYNDLVDTELSFKDAQIEAMKASTEKAYNDIMVDTNRLALDMNLTNKSIEEIQAKIDRMEFESYVDLSKLPYEINVLEASIYELYSRGHLNIANAREAIAAVYKIGAETYKVGVDIGLERAQISEIMANVSKIDASIPFEQAKGEIAKVVGKFVKDNAQVMEFASWLYLGNKTGLFKGIYKGSGAIYKALRKNTKVIEKVSKKEPYYVRSSGQVGWKEVVESVER